MAEIDIERREGHRWWPWALAVMLLLIVGAAAWFWTGGYDDAPDITPDMETPEMQQGTQAAPRDLTPPDSVAPMVVP